MRHGFSGSLAYLLALSLFLSACLASPKPVDRLHESMSEATGYLRDEFDPDLGLLRESPESRPDHYWLATDNWLAAHALAAAGEDKFSEQIKASINAYNLWNHGLIEALDGDTIEWPPETAEQFQVEGADPRVWMEVRTTDNRMDDWYEYVDLRMYGAINALNRSDRNLARELYLETISEFEADQYGFHDKAFDGEYATYKLALTLYVGALLQEPTNENLLEALLAKQTTSGGFIAMYDMQGKHVRDSNTETTSYALLALTALDFAKP